ncbi:MAG: hypothetical protein ACHQ9S_08440 [Candidatus Binatia bacterium]
MKWRFAGKFLLAFAVLLVLWWWVNFADLYRMAVLSTVQLLSPAVNGWWLDFDRPNPVGDVVFRSGKQQLAMLLQLPALSMGLVPLLSLILATPGFRVRQAAIRCVLGVVLYFVLDVAVILAYPFIMDRPNIVKDTLGVFTGLMAVVVAPLGLWFVLTYSALRPLWQLTPRRQD